MVMLCPGCLIEKRTLITCGVFRMGGGGGVKCEVEKEKSTELLVLCLFSKSSGQQ